MKKRLLLILIMIGVQSCAAFEPQEKETEAQVAPVVEVEDITESELPPALNITAAQRADSEKYLYYYVTHSFSQADVGAEGNDENIEKSGVKTEANGYGHLYVFNGEKSLILSEVVSKMADQLLYNFPKKHRKESIALTSIVDLNNHQKTNWLGQTISEQFFHELHIRKLKLVDYKLTGNIQVTANGEFALTRDWKKLNKDVDVQRILTGTMSRNEEGMIINVRIVNAASNLVETTSSAFIPHSLFVGGEYDYSNKKYFARDTRQLKQGKAQVRLVK